MHIYLICSANGHVRMCHHRNGLKWWMRVALCRICGRIIKCAFSWRHYDSSFAQMQTCFTVMERLVLMDFNDDGGSKIYRHAF